MSSLRIAFPKEGKIKTPLLKRVEQAGLILAPDSVHKEYARLIDTKNILPSIPVAMMRSSSVAKSIKIGRVNAGFAGRDKLKETAPRYREFNTCAVAEFDIAECSVCIIGRKGLDIKSPADLEGKRVITSYRDLSKRIFSDIGISTNPEYWDGDIEALIAEGYADAAVEIVDTGGSINRFGLQKYLELMSSSVVGVKDVNLDEGLSNVFEAICDRIKNGEERQVTENTLGDRVAIFRLNEPVQFARQRL